MRAVLVAVVFCLSAASPARAQAPAPLAASIRIANGYRATPNLTYLTVGNVALKLDVYQARAATSPNRTLVWIHGGNWVGGSKDASLLSLLPFFELGWHVVNVDYRLLDVAAAPAAVEDCHCALRWVAEHAREYGIDPSRVVVAGNSAGGQLALMAAMAPLSAGFDVRCPGPVDLKPAAVINWYGFPSLVDVLSGPHANQAVNTWIGPGPSRQDLALRLSPQSYVRPGGVPVLTVHGDQDPTSAYEYAVQFHASLERAGVVHDLVTVPGGKHGGFTNDETATIYARILAFLERVLPAA